MAKTTTNRHSLRPGNNLAQDLGSATSQLLAPKVEAFSEAKLNRKASSRAVYSEPSLLVDCSAALLEPQVLSERPPRANRRLEVVFSELLPSLRSQQDSRPVDCSVALVPTLLEHPRLAVCLVNRLRPVLPEVVCSGTPQQGRPQVSVNLLPNPAAASSVRPTSRVEEDYSATSTLLSKDNRISKVRPVVCLAPSQTPEALACSVSRRLIRV